MANFDACIDAEAMPGFGVDNAQRDKQALASGLVVASRDFAHNLDEGNAAAKLNADLNADLNVDLNAELKLPVEQWAYDFG